MTSIQIDKYEMVTNPNPGASVFVVRGDEAENILVSQHYSLKYLNLSEPGFFVDGRKYFDGDIFATPFALGGKI